MAAFARGACSYPCNPPRADPSIAASANAVVETSNDAIVAWARADSSVLFAAPLWYFFGIPEDQTSMGEPRVYFDRNHGGGRWLLVERSSGGVINQNGVSSYDNTGALWFALSSSANPLEPWNVYVVLDEGQAPTNLALGLSDDKVVLATDEYTLNGISGLGTWLGAKLWVADWADLLDGGGFATSVKQFPTTIVGWRPAIGQVGASGTVGNNDVYAIGTTMPTDSMTTPALLTRVSGGVVAGTVTFADPIDLTASGASPFDRSPRVPRQPGYGGIGAIGDGRPLEAIEQGSSIWFTANASCAGPSTCVRLTEVSVAAGPSSPTVANDKHLSATNFDTFAPGIALTVAGTLELVYNESSATSNVMTYQVQRTPADARGVLSSPVLLAGSINPFNGDWTRFSAMAQDPAAPEAIWQASVTSTWYGWDSHISRLSPATGAPTGSLAADRGAYYLWLDPVLLEATSDGTSATTVVRVTATLYAGAPPTQLIIPIGESGYGEYLRRPGKSGTTTTLSFEAGDGVSWGPTRSIIARNPANGLRLAGSDRYATAAEISAKTFAASVPVAYIATGANFPDALAGAAVAGRQGGPVLMVTQNAIPASAQAELSRLRPAKIYVLGSKGVISDAVVTGLKAYTSGPVTRLAGNTRFETAAEVSKQAYPHGARTVFLAYAYNFPDALSGAAAASAFGAPILLTDTATLNATTAAEIKRLNPDNIVILGSSGVISTSVETGLKTSRPSTNVVRWGGKDRFETSAIIAYATWGTCGASGDRACGPYAAYVATGYNYPDALAGAAAAGWTGGPIVLIQPNSVPAISEAALRHIYPARVVGLGSKAVLSDVALEWAAMAGD